MSRKVLVVDDDPSILRLVGKVVGEMGLEVREASDALGAERALDQGGFAAVVCDLMLGEISSLELLKEHRRRHPDVPFLVMTGWGDLETTVDVMQAGAFDFLAKPLDLVQVSNAVRRALDARRDSDDGAVEERAWKPGGLVGRAPCMVEMFKLIARFAQSDSAVLIEGETGTGKELVARSIHLYGPRGAKRFVAVNCAALPEALLESELFGHVKGAFTGASADRPGLFREADKGTLLLDEVGELAPPLQAKLLRALQERRVRPVGGTAEAAVDVRVLCATHRPLEELIRGGRFRQDLFYRVSTLRVVVPPLRERPEDLGLLVSAYLSDRGRGATAAPEAIERLRGHAWPGNVRELFHALERALAMSGGRGRLTAEDFEWLSDASPGVPAARSSLRPLGEVEKDHILSVLSAVGGNKHKAAEVLGIDRKTLHRKLKGYGVK